jgi:hypothetical protein
MPSTTTIEKKHVSPICEAFTLKINPTLENNPQSPQTAETVPSGTQATKYVTNLKSKTPKMPIKRTSKE